MTKHTESVSGFKIVGDWGEIVEHGERVAFALEELESGDEYDEALTEYNEWRPKASEDINKDVSEKTAKKASVKKNKVEEKGKKPSDELGEAKEKLSDTVNKMEEPDEAVDTWSSSIKHITLATDTFIRKTLRSTEEFVYQRFMTLISPYYFDNELVSANLSEKDTEFVFEINVNDDDMKSDVSDKLEEYHQEHDRWHVSAKSNTDNIEAIEGVDVPVNSGDEDNPKPTIN